MLHYDHYPSNKWSWFTASLWSLKGVFGWKEFWREIKGRDLKGGKISYFDSKIGGKGFRGEGIGTI